MTIVKAQSRDLHHAHLGAVYLLLVRLVMDNLCIKFEICLASPFEREERGSCHKNTHEFEVALDEQQSKHDRVQ